MVNESIPLGDLNQIIFLTLMGLKFMNQVDYNFNLSGLAFIAYLKKITYFTLTFTKSECWCFCF